MKPPGSPLSLTNRFRLLPHKALMAGLGLLRHFFKK